MKLCMQPFWKIGNSGLICFVEAVCLCPGFSNDASCRGFTGDYTTRYVEESIQTVERRSILILSVISLAGHNIIHLNADVGRDRMTTTTWLMVFVLVPALLSFGETGEWKREYDFTHVHTMLETIFVLTILASMETINTCYYRHSTKASQNMHAVKGGVVPTLSSRMYPYLVLCGK